MSEMAECGLHFPLPLHAPGSPGLPMVAQLGILLPASRGLVGPPHPRRARTPHPAPAPAPPPRRAGPSPCPPPPPPGSPHARRSSGLGPAPRARLRRWPDAEIASVSCYGNPDRGKFRIRARRSPGRRRVRPSHPGPRRRPRSGPSPRPTRGASPAAEHPAPEMPEDADRAEFAFPLYHVKTCQISRWLEPPKTTGTLGEARHAPGFSIEEP